jgi:pSer/pThr/pTyr-binding forkhead associated (FHA) protein
MARAKLVLQREGEDDVKVKLPVDEELVIGGKQGTRFELADEAAAYRHARILVKGDRYLLEDLGSPGGTFVNEESVMKCPLADGDVIRIGDTRLVFKAAAKVAPAGKPTGSVAPKVKLDRPPPKEMPHFDRPEPKVVKVKLVSGRERTKHEKPDESTPDET